MGSKKITASYVISAALLAFGFSFIHIHHVATLFENDRHFSHLSNLEREMTFRTEMGFYYYYFKVIVNAPTFDHGIREIMHDNKTEYPDIINALQRFNLYPEIIIGGFYRVFDTVCKFFNIANKQCWEVSRGPTLSSVSSCEGFGDPVYFYLEFVWYCAGLSCTALFLYAAILSDTHIGGVLAILNFFYNHGHCTRVQWSPPLRESFAYPFCILQMLAVTCCLKTANDVSNTNRRIFLQVWCIATLTALSIVLWQFSQFFIATQTICVILLYCARIINRRTLLIIVVSQLVGLFKAAILLFGNTFLFQSILFSLLLATIVVVMGSNNRIQRPLFRAIFIIIAITAITISLKVKISQFFDAHDSHILDLMASKLTDFRNFHTMLYTCSPEFDFLPYSTISDMMQTGLIPTVAFVLFLLLLKWRKDLMDLLTKPTMADCSRSIDPDVAYNVLQLGAFTVMAAFIMRLKLFWSPHLCLIASLITSPRYLPLKANVKYSMLITLIAVMSYQGITNISTQRNIIGEYVNIPFEEVLNWINSETLQTDVFAGPMSVMANVLLSTGRRIVNHPHYEHQKMRERTMKVYSIFSRHSPQEVYSVLLGMGVDYVILDDSWCFPRSKENCSMVDLWDLVDPENRSNESLCPRLFESDPSPFIRVFANELFVILSLKARHSVDITPHRYLI